MSLQNFQSGSSRMISAASSRVPIPMSARSNPKISRRSMQCLVSELESSSLITNRRRRRRTTPVYNQSFTIPRLSLSSYHRGSTQAIEQHIKIQPNFTIYRCYKTISPQNNNSVDMHVGRGTQMIQHSSQPEKLSPISPEQRKAADLELERMKLSTEHIISTLSEFKKGDGEHQSRENQLSIAFMNELSVTCNYWVSRWLIHYHPYLTPSPTNVLPMLKPRDIHSSMDDNDNSCRGINILDDSSYSDYGTNQALSILKGLLETEDLDLIRNILFSNGNVVLINLIESMLLPCTTNFTQRKTNDGNNIGLIRNDNNCSSDSEQHDGQSFVASSNINAIDNIASTRRNDYVQFSSNTALHNIQPSIWKACLIDACHLIDVMHNLQQNCQIEMDINSYNVRLFTLSKLATLLHILKYQEQSGGLNKNTHLVKWEEGSDVKHKLNLHNLFGTKDKEHLNQVLASSLQMRSVNEVVQSMEGLLKTMENSESKIKPNHDSYNFVISAIARSDENDAPSRAEWYLRRMEKTEDIEMNVYISESDTDDEDLPKTFALADTSTYNLVLNAFASTRASKNKAIDDSARRRAAEANAILQRMEERYNRMRREEIRPDVLSYSTILSCYANAGMATEAEEILNKMIHLSSDDANGEGIRPNLICFNTVIDAWAKTRGLYSAEKAYGILTQMENLAEMDKDLYPDTITYSAAISAFARSGRDDAGDRAEELLQQSLYLYKNEGRSRLKPDSITFITVLDALSKQCLRVFKKRRNLAECHQIEQRMKNILQQMDNLGANVRPCTVSHNIILDLYAKTLQAEKAERHLQEHMVESYQNGNQNLKPDIISYNSLLLALSGSQQNESLQRAERLLRSMEDGTLPHGIDVKPDIISYNSVMSGFKRNVDRSSIYMVHDLLLHMEDRFENGLSNIKPNIITYNILLDAWNKSQHPDMVNQVNYILEKMIESDNVQPDVFSFTSAISTLASSGKDDAPEKALKVIKRMQALNIKPNRITYNSLINCWSKSRRKGAAEKAEDILIRMTEMDAESSPDAISFSSVINCWAQSGEHGCGERAEAILDMMESNWKAGNKDMKPNRFTYASVLNAFAKSRDRHSLDRALNLLGRMEEKYLEGNDEARPTEPAYNAVIYAYARSSLPTKAIESQSILETMREAYQNGNRDAKPSIRSYSGILNACAHIPQASTIDNKIKAQTFKIARQSFKEILSGKHGRPNSMAFSQFIASCINLVGAGTKRDQLIQTVFEECCQQGLVDVKIILEIRRSSPMLRKQLLESVGLADGMIQSDDIPYNWRCNIHSTTRQ